MKKIFCTFMVILALLKAFPQNVGIGTNNPNPKAILDVKATDKGILFPRMNTAQRDAIASPPDGLHIFNTDEQCLNYYDSVLAIWNCYCSACEANVITISTSACNVDFYNSYAKANPSGKYIVNILSGVVLSGCKPGDTALSFSTMPSNAVIVINNHGVIIGAGGAGGAGNILDCPTNAFPPVFPRYEATAGKPGGYAVSTKANVVIRINNYAAVLGGGGGGGGGNSGGTFNIPLGYGGGGGGGAGSVGGTGGNGGKEMEFGCGVAKQSPNGHPGDSTSPGNGGSGIDGGGFGGKGGAWGLAGQAGQGRIHAAGGAGGKAIGGGSGNVINNIGSGDYYGTVD